MAHSNRKILITGGAKRVGAGLTRAAAADGWEVLIHCHQNRQAADALAAELQQDGATASVLQADLADEAACRQLMQSAFETGPLDALINNASLFRYDDTAAFKSEDIAAHMAVNLAAPARLTADMVAALKGRHHGVVINMLDAKLFGLNPDYFTYTLSKAALKTMTEMMAQAFAPHLRINAIAPGITLPSGGQSQAEFEEAHKRNPLGKGAEIAEIVAAMRLLLNATSMTGHHIVLDGGAHLCPEARDVAFLKD